MAVASPPPADTGPRKRVRLTVRGTVQGVGFRPFVYRTAREFGIGGSVANTTAGVSIEARADPTRSRGSSAPSAGVRHRQLGQPRSRSKR